ncbi:MAG: two-component regulator propeller domain-containing protein, partial [Bacteroidota bacterium]
MKWFHVLFLILWGQQLIVGQDPLINRIGPRQGLPSATVFRVLPDGPGRVWLGTENGLVHSNGHSLTHYPFTDSIYRNAVLGLCDDGDSGLWVSLFRQGVYHYRDQQLQKVLGPAYHLERIIGLRQDSQGTTLGLSSREGLLRLSLEGYQQVLPHRKCLSLTLVADTFWVGTDSGLYTCSAPNYHFQVFPGTEGLHIRDFNASPTGRKWMISDQGLFSFRVGKWVSANLPESREPVSYLCPDAHGYVWLAFKQRG